MAPKAPTAAPAEQVEKTPERIELEANALLAMFGEKADGPSEAERQRNERLESVAAVIGKAAVDVARLIEGTSSPEKKLQALQSLKTAKDRANAAIRAIPDDVLVVVVPDEDDSELSGLGE